MPNKGVYVDISISPARPGVGVLQVPDVDPRNVDETTVRAFLGTKWGWTTMKGVNGVSLVRGADGSWIACRNGEIVTTGKDGKASGVQMPDSGYEHGKCLGPPWQIRQIGKKLFVCGMSGQVYTQDGKGNWVHMDKGMVQAGPAGPSSLMLHGIHGSSETDLYVVGAGGFISHWNGKTWTRVQVTTNANLWAVRLFENRFVAVGDMGVIVEGDGKVWKVDRIPQADDTSLFDVDYYKGKLYVAAIGFLLSRSGSTWQIVDHGLDEKTTDFYKLAVGEGKLWAKGKTRLYSFDGKKWQAHPDPDNG